MADEDQRRGRIPDEICEAILTASGVIVQATLKALQDLAAELTLPHLQALTMLDWIGPQRLLDIAESVEVTPPAATRLPTVFQNDTWSAAFAEAVTAARCTLQSLAPAVSWSLPCRDVIDVSSARDSCTSRMPNDGVGLRCSPESSETTRTPEPATQ